MKVCFYRALTRLNEYVATMSRLDLQFDLATTNSNDVVLIFEYIFGFFKNQTPFDHRPISDMVVFMQR